MSFIMQYIFFVLILVVVFYLFGGWKLLFNLSKIVIKRVKNIKEEMERDK